MKRLLLAVFLMGCASVPQYQDIPQVKIVIQNTRTSDGIDPQFYLVGLGRLSLGVVSDLRDRTVYVDQRWLTPDGCLTIIAHFVGEGDWTFDKLCWHPGETVDVKLMPIISTSSAWSHR